LGLDPSNYSKNSHLPLRQARRLYHWTVLVSTYSGRQSARMAKAATAPGRAACDSLAWLGSLRPNGPRPRPLQGLGDPFGILAKEVDRHLEGALQLSHDPLAPVRFWPGACRTRPGRVRAAGGLNENVASRHAAFLDDAFEAWRRIDVFSSRRSDQYSLLACRKGRIPGPSSSYRGDNADNPRRPAAGKLVPEHGSPENLAPPIETLCSRAAFLRNNPHSPFRVAAFGQFARRDARARARAQIGRRNTAFRAPPILG